MRIGPRIRQPALGMCLAHLALILFGVKTGRAALGALLTNSEGAAGMARVSKRLEHDWIRVSVSFDDGNEVRVRWNRGGSDVSIAPRDTSQANRLSVIVDRAVRLPGVTVGDVVEVIERVGLGADSVNALVDGVSTVLGVNGDITLDARDRTEVAVKVGRSIVVSGAFQSGEEFELKINKSSVGLETKPSISARDSDILKIVFAIKSAGIMTDEELADRLKDVAEKSTDMDQWIEEARDFMRAAPRP